MHRSSSNLHFRNYSEALKGQWSNIHLCLKHERVLYLRALLIKNLWLQLYPYSQGRFFLIIAFFSVLFCFNSLVVFPVSEFGWSSQDIFCTITYIKNITKNSVHIVQNSQIVKKFHFNRLNMSHRNYILFNLN